MRSMRTVGDAMSKSRMSKTCSPLTTSLPGLGRDTSTVPWMGRVAPWKVTSPSTWNRSAAPTARATPEVEGDDRMAAGVDPAEQLGVVEAVAGAQARSPRSPGARTAPARAAPRRRGPRPRSRPVTPTAPKVIGPTVERASIRTTERSGTTANRARVGRAGERRGDGRLVPPVGQHLAPAPDRHRGLDAVAVPLDARRRRHRGPRMPRHRGPAALGLGQRGVDRPGRHVAAQHEVQAVPLLLDDPHPPPQGALALRRSGRTPAGPGRPWACRPTTRPGRPARAGQVHDRRSGGRRGRSAGPPGPWRGCSRSRAPRTAGAGARAGGSGGAGRARSASAAPPARPRRLHDAPSHSLDSRPGMTAGAHFVPSPAHHVNEAAGCGPRTGAADRTHGGVLGASSVSSMARDLRTGEPL